MGTSKIQDVQFLRGVAVASVMLHHASLGSTLVSATVPAGFASPFYLGVELFFVISGYVVTLSLVRRGSVNPFEFLWRRSFRLLPAMIAFIAFSLLVMLAALQLDPNPYRDARLVGWARFSDNAFHTLTGTIIDYVSDPLYYFGAMWSLSVEFQFYIAYAAVAGLAARVFPVRTAMLWVAVSLLGAAVVCRLSGYPAAGIVHHLIHWRFDYLLVGVAIALAPPIPWPPLAAKAAFGAAFVVASAAATITQTAPVLLMILFGIVVSAASQNTLMRRRGWLYDAFVWIGDRSYSAYLLHLPVYALFWVMAVTWFGWIFSGAWLYAMGQYAFCTVITLALADLTFRAVELPMIDVGKTLWRAMFANRFAMRH